TGFIQPGRISAARPGGGAVEIQVLTEFEKTQIGQAQPLPERYLRLPGEARAARIAAACATLASRTVLRGHHSERGDAIRYADYTGDSLKLAQYAATKTAADFIVFCGVHFMAESADLLSAPHQQVILPDLAAGCSMADMAAIDQLETCWTELTQMGATSVVPVTYINSRSEERRVGKEWTPSRCTSAYKHKYFRDVT